MPSNAYKYKEWWIWKDEKMSSKYATCHFPDSQIIQSSFSNVKLYNVGWNSNYIYLPAGIFLTLSTSSTCFFLRILDEEQKLCTSSLGGLVHVSNIRHCRSASVMFKYSLQSGVLICSNYVCNQGAGAFLTSIHGLKLNYVLYTIFNVLILDGRQEEFRIWE